MSIDTATLAPRLLLGPGPSPVSDRILEALGRLFKNNLKLYVYPTLDVATGDVVTVESMMTAPSLVHLHAHLVQNHFIESLDVLDREHLKIFPRDVLAMIQTGKAGWEELFRTHELAHNRRRTVRIEVSKEGDGAFAVVDVDTLWRRRSDGELFEDEEKAVLSFGR